MVIKLIASPVFNPPKILACSQQFFRFLCHVVLQIDLGLITGLLFIFPFYWIKLVMYFINYKCLGNEYKRNLHVSYLLLFLKEFIKFIYLASGLSPNKYFFSFLMHVSYIPASKIQIHHVFDQQCYHIKIIFQVTQQTPIWSTVNFIFEQTSVV